MIDVLVLMMCVKGDDVCLNNVKSYVRWEFAYTTEKETLWLLGLKMCLKM